MVLSDEDFFNLFLTRSDSRRLDPASTKMEQFAGEVGVFDFATLNLSKCWVETRAIEEEKNYFKVHCHRSQVTRCFDFSHEFWVISMWHRLAMFPRLINALYCRQGRSLRFSLQESGEGEWEDSRHTCQPSWKIFFCCYICRLKVMSDNQIQIF